MGSGKMQKRTKNSKAIRIYNKCHDSFKKLKDKRFFNYFYTFQKDYEKPLFESLIAFIKEFNPYDQVDIQDIEELFDTHFEAAEINYDLDVPDEVKRVICKNIYSIYIKGVESFNKFRGEVVEYIIVYLEKDNSNSIYHEPLFYHKREKLFKTGFVGESCLIDIVKFNQRNHDVTLIECKANLDVTIRNMKYKKNKFKNKLRLMDALKLRLETYENSDGRPVKIQKSLATINDPKRKLPNKYIDYQYINLFDHFKKSLS